MNQELQDLIPEDWLDPADYVPSELLLDSDHPANDGYAQDLRHIEQKLHAFSRLLKPKKRELARLIRAGLSPKDIARKLNAHVTSIRTWAKDPDVIRLTVLMDYHQHKLDGADLSHRKGVLWRIALDNEEKRPNIAIQAIQEINKVSAAYQSEGNTGNQGNVVNISINGDLLPRTGLDVLPDTFESRVRREELDNIEDVDVG